MTQERFLKLLDNPELLATISYEELKTLALTYPYAHNLRYLLAIKADQDQHPDFIRNLATAAAYSLDRTCLFSLIPPKKLIPQPVLAGEEQEVLELKPIATVQQHLESQGPVLRSVQEPATSKKTKAIDFSSGPEDSQETAKSEVPVLDFTQATPSKTQRTAGQPKQQQVETKENPELVLPVKQVQSFSVWISQFNPPALVTGNAIPEEEQPTADAPFYDAAEKTTGELTPQMLAEKSVTESKSILSETLARLYVDQGYLDKAIDMYERLGLAFPDKSAYFAGEIEKLKK